MGIEDEGITEPGDRGEVTFEVVQDCFRDAIALIGTTRDLNIVGGLALMNNIPNERVLINCLLQVIGHLLPPDDGEVAAKLDRIRRIGPAGSGSF